MALKPSLHELVERQGWVSGALLALLAVYVLWFAKALLLPIFLALLFSALLRPVVRLLARVRVPDWLGAGLVVVCIVGLVVTVFVQLSTPAGEWVQRFPVIKIELQEKISMLRGTIEQAQQVAEDIEEVASVSKSNNPSVTVEGPGLLQRVFIEAQTAAANIVIVVVLVYFLLARGNASFSRLLDMLFEGEQRALWFRVVHEIEHDIARYLLAVAAINLVLGTLTALAMWGLGMPTPFLWGVLAGLLNFIPYAGALVTLAIISVVSIVSFDAWIAILAPPAVFLALTSLEGQIVNPLVVGRQLTLDPIFVFVSILFWGWLWGFPGMLLAVPILASVRIAVRALQSDESSRAGADDIDTIQAKGSEP